MHASLIFYLAEFITKIIDITLIANILLRFKQVLKRACLFTSSMSTIPFPLLSPATHVVFNPWLYDNPPCPDAPPRRELPPL